MSEVVDLGKSDPFSFANRRLLPPFAALRAFEAVGALGGIRRAAAALNLDHAAVSRHVRRLEMWAGCPLIDRDRGSGALTQDGAAFHGRISAALNEIASASVSLTRRGDDSRLTLWCAPGLASEWLAHRLSEFSQTHTNLDVELQPTESAPDFTRYEADIDIRYIVDGRRDQYPVASDVAAITVARPAVIAVCSPEFARTIGAIESAADLLPLPLLHEHDASQWRRWFAAQDVEVSAVSGPKLWHANLTLNSARLGHGVALTNAFLAGDEIRSGRLVNLTPPGPEIILGAYELRARRDRWRSPAILAFRRWFQKSMAQVQGPVSRAA
ncbi:LysR substrate-binding domain-containing protein [uncultured Caulobacter sp.]|uniref:LysR substrate-binding domain-containing protein n=1 Tax=uncultured Caulobacter sp. TaxID=158749 RepID=UPI002639D9EA|nr:LysR substrate-binding domain-containing protein [uncultured Caulobacter sp.]